MRKNKKNIAVIGDKFGSYTVISSEIVRKQYRAHFYVECSCGVKKWLPADYLSKYINPRCLSCRSKEACVKAIETRKAKGNIHKGIGELNKTFINKMQHSAKRRHHEWNVSIEYLWNLYIDQNKQCSLSKLPINFSQHLKNGRYDCINANCSLDRIDSKIGYIEGNVQWVHKDINRMKSNFKQEYFKQLCKYVTEND